MRLNERRHPSYLGIWDTSSEAGVDVGKGTHPAGFPVALAQWVLAVHSDRGELVLDPFAGTGTTAVAAMLEDRPSVSIELSPHYCDVILDRWERTTGIAPERVTPALLQPQ